MCRVSCCSQVACSGGGLPGDGSVSSRRDAFRNAGLAVDGLADAYIQFLYLLTGQNLFVLPQFFVEKAQFGAVVDDVRNLFSSIRE